MKCCFCGKEIVGYGNNPYPFPEGKDARCCDACNMDVVVPARLAMLQLSHELEDIMNKLKDEVSENEDTV